ncbi:uncharacterized protein LOC112170640 [Rosa chinensis]|uniref:uncharacterized protein LOC112170640 n=1 Tax=Rosa chinensis TaxID=74649 RepID=UPI000D0923E1|nr:uncharacterized protein LOC112170640 [Rosa chinensis]
MSKEISGSVIDCKNARDMWLELQECFSHTNTIQLFNIENAIHECEKGTGSVTSFFTRLKSLWDERDAICEIPPCSCEARKELKSYMENQKTMKFLMGLNDNCAAIRSNTVAIDPLPTVNKAYLMALRHEKQAEASNGKPVIQPEAAIFAMKKGGRDLDLGDGEARCEKCHKTNHRTKNCRAHLKCTYFRWKDHTYDYCRRRKDAAEGGQGSSKGNHVVSIDDKKFDGINFPFSQEDCKQLVELLSKNKVATANQVGNIPNYEELSGKTYCFPQHGKASVCILDSGASDHIVCTPTFLTSLTIVHNRFVKLPDGTSA